MGITSNMNVKELEDEYERWWPAACAMLDSWVDKRRACRSIASPLKRHREWQRCHWHVCEWRRQMYG